MSLIAPTTRQILSLVTPSHYPAATGNWVILVNQLKLCAITSAADLIGIAATIAVETAHTFTPLREFGSEEYCIENYWDNLEIRKELGNIYPSDAFNFRGGGFIQFTGRNNYQLLSNALGYDFIAHPDLLCDPIISSKALAFYWVHHHINSICEQIRKLFLLDLVPSATVIRNWQAVRRAVNGGLNGWDDFQKALLLLNAIPKSGIQKQSTNLPVVPHEAIDEDSDEGEITIA